MTDATPEVPVVNGLQWVAGVVVDTVERLARLIGDDTSRRAVLRDLGLEPVAGQSVDTDELLSRMSGDLAAVRSYAEANADQADVAALAAAIESIANLVDAVASQLETVTSNMPAGRGAAEFVAALLQMFVIQLMRDENPVFYAFARAAQVLTDEALLIDWDRVADAIEDFFAAFALDSEDDAVLASPWIAAVATAAGAMVALAAKDVSDDAGGDSGDDAGDSEGLAFDVVYGWDPDPTLPEELRPAERIAERTITMFFGDALGDRASASLAVVPAVHGGPGFLVALGGQALIGGLDEDAGGPNPGVRLRIGAGSAASAYLPLRGSPQPARLFGPDALSLSAEVAGARRRRVLGPADGTRIEGGQVLIDFRVLGDGAVLRWGVRDAALIVDLSADGFLSDVIAAGEVRIPFDVVVGIDTRHGFFVEGGTGLSATIPVHRNLAGVRVDHVTLALDFPESSALRLDVSAVVGVGLGMFQAVVDQVGFTLEVDFSGGNLALADVSTRFHAPRGIGLTLGFEELRGGGYLYLDPDKGEYAGVLELDFGGKGLQALGILTTKGLPHDEWALLLIVFATVTPPVSAAGWVLGGVGGVIGVHHAVSEEAFRDGLRTKALDDVLFPKDPVANASRILATLRSVFPVTADTALIGIAADFRYLASQRATIRVGVILQVGDTGPERVVILGRLKVRAPGERNDLISLNADLFGVVAWGEDQVRIAVDSRLFDSKIGAGGARFTITGSLSARVTLGRDRMIVFTCGGFHPDFDVPADLALPAKLDRFGFKLSKGIARMTLSGYVALTPCTLQFGVKLEIVAKKFGFSLEAAASLDVLLDQEDGRFSTDVKVMAALKRGSTTLMKIDLEFSLSGPGRWRATGVAKFKLLFVSRSICFDEAWGAEEDAALPLVDAVAALVAELAEPANWGSVPATRALVALRTANGSATVLVHPLAELSVQQRLLPLGVTLDRIGGNRITGPNRLDITAVRVGQRQVDTVEPLRDDFARGQFVDLSEDQALALPSFEPMRSGVVVSAAGAQAGTAREQAVAYETIYPLPEDRPPVAGPYRPPFAQVVMAAGHGAVARATRPVSGATPFRSELPDIGVAVHDRAYVVADGDTMTAIDGQVGVPLHEALDLLAAARAAGGRHAVLVGSHEVGA